MPGRDQLSHTPRAADGASAPSPAAQDILLGEPGDAPSYIDADQYERWRRPDSVLDLAAGAAEGFSLGPADLHFVTRTVA